MSTAAPDPTLGQLRDALAAADRERLDVVVGELAAWTASADPDTAEATSREALGLLRRHRRFSAMLEVAEATFKAGAESPTVVRQYGQALIEEGLLGAALATLVPLRGRAGTEDSEIDGLIGRAYKQRYVDSPTSRVAGESLRNAIDAYLTRYHAAPEENPWHGINAVALLARAERDGVAAGTEASWRTIADHVLASTATHVRTVWDAAIAAEAYVALGDFRAAAGWLADYTSGVDDGFAIAATLRQLRQLWQIDEADPRQRALVDLLEARLLQAAGGRLEVAVHERARELDQNDDYLEAVFGEDEYKTIGWYRAGLEAAKGVVRIKRALGGTIGTGFVLPGGELRATWAGTLVVVTNFHVVNRSRLWPGHDLTVAFEDGAREIPIQEVLWESPAALVGSNPPGSVDTAVLRLAADLPGPPSYQRAPGPGPKVGERVYVIGHPRGQDLAFSLNDNKVVGASDVLLHYRAPTR
ncbi:MAG: trypsin-like peptidase domain-containing protein, partial [Actinomycetota bacterium]|nr:trypsin-like peptidase domain-containing protein [Actinomycetota bacterium]